MKKVKLGKLKKDGVKISDCVGVEFDVLSANISEFHTMMMISEKAGELMVKVIERCQKDEVFMRSIVAEFVASKITQINALEKSEKTSLFTKIKQAVSK